MEHFVARVVVAHIGKPDVKHSDARAAVYDKAANERNDREKEELDSFVVKAPTLEGLKAKIAAIVEAGL